jgi:hypothetical protein
MFPFEIMQSAGGRNECPFAHLSRYRDAGFVHITEAEPECETTGTQEFAGIGSRVSHCS